jgi:hypothetical protein
MKSVWSSLARAAREIALVAVIATIAIEAIGGCSEPSGPIDAGIDDEDAPVDGGPDPRCVEVCSRCGEVNCGSFWCSGAAESCLVFATTCEEVGACIGHRPDAGARD